MAAYLIVGIVAYLIGSVSFSVIFSKKIAGFDVREKGSGNAGATNVLIVLVSSKQRECFRVRSLRV